MTIFPISTEPFKSLSHSKYSSVNECRPSRSNHKSPCPFLYAFPDHLTGSLKSTSSTPTKSQPTTEVASHGLRCSFGTIYRPLEFATSINAVSPCIMNCELLVESLNGAMTSTSLSSPSGRIECMQSTKPSPPSEIGSSTTLVEGKCYCSAVDTIEVKEREERVSLNLSKTKRKGLRDVFI